MLGRTSCCHLACKGFNFKLGKCFKLCARKNAQGAKREGIFELQAATIIKGNPHIYAFMVYACMYVFPCVRMFKLYIVTMRLQWATAACVCVGVCEYIYIYIQKTYIFYMYTSIHV